jgi:bifunctional UDP-N-acetylglucosamine pyrophosphorylase/glucosamine-1-phosphate N-acetyltransferase
MSASRLKPARHSRPLAVVVLAAGEGKRFKSKTPKILHDLCGKPLLAYALDAVAPLRAQRTIVVVGRDADRVKDALKTLTKKKITVAVQAQQLGTADAARVGDDALRRFSGDVLVVPADTPLLPSATLKALVGHHRRTNAAATILTADMHDPRGYGRIVRAPDGSIDRIVEESDASPEERRITEVNGGVWVFDRAALRAALTKIDRANAQKEFYLTDIVQVLRDKGERVETHEAPSQLQVFGVNTRVHLATAAQLMRALLCEAFMLEGVSIVDPFQTYIDAGVKIGRDTVINPMTFLSGSTKIGEGCEIGPGVRAKDTVIEDGARVLFATLDGARVGPEATVGPYAYLRPGARLAKGAKVGTFVEVKASTVGAKSKVPHLSYIGDATIGADVNVGAGTITCNYDGVTKHRTVIGDGAFVGSDTMLVAPVKIGRGAYTGAGSAIGKDVPAGALGIERAEQKNVRDWAKKRAREKKPRGGHR